MRHNTRGKESELLTFRYAAVDNLDASPRNPQIPNFIRMLKSDHGDWYKNVVKYHRKGKVRYTGYRDRPQEERQVRFQNACREGHTEIAFVATGTNLQLVFAPPSNSYMQNRECDFDKEPGKIHIKSSLIMNGVCVRWRGWIDLERLDGVGCLEYCEDRAAAEDALLREQIERYNQRLREFEDKQRGYRSQDRIDQDLELRMANSLHGSAHHGHHGGPVSSRCHGPPRHGLPLQGRKKNDLNHGHHN
ncbi:protein big brother-like [Photinus pyralis]|uniref:protein big brother-like n=1 Tax=Photinus pyralis TaxID=7054 RepID=UPI0012675804|nr:protein big brother-like [Photinus pyralis]